MNIKKTKIKKINVIENQDVYDITVVKNNNFFANNVCVHNCGEITLSELDSCRLMTINLFSYVKNPFTLGAKFDFEKFYKHSMILQRLMDDMVDLEIEKVSEIIKKVESDPEPLIDKERELYMWKKIKENSELGRRTGSGIIALGDTLAALGYTYADEKSFEFIDKLFRYFNEALFESSIEIAKEIGPFPIFNWEKEKNNQFLLRIKENNPNLYNMASKYGHRNISWSTIAPTGSVSILAGTTSGVEPLFMTSYMRRKKVNPTDKNVKVDFKDQNGDSWQEFEVIHPKLKMWLELNPDKTIEQSPYFNSTAQKINWRNKIKMIGIIQKYISHSISNTLNLPENATKEDVSDCYFIAKDVGAKGVTIYRDGSRTGVLVKKKEKKAKEQIEVREYLNKEKFENNAIKRPKRLPADVFHFRIKNSDYYTAVGLLNEKPYEIFVSSNYVDEESVNVPKYVISGEIVKVKRGEYKLVAEQNKKEYIISCTDCDPNAEALTRMISVSLRHNVDISFIVQQLEKIMGFNNYPKVLAKTLKKYIDDGTIVTGDTCGNCGSNNLARVDGCIVCSDCGWTKC